MAHPLHDLVAARALDRLRVPGPRGGALHLHLLDQLVAGEALDDAGAVTIQPLDDRLDRGVTSDGQVRDGHAGRRRRAQRVREAAQRSLGVRLVHAVVELFVGRAEADAAPDYLRGCERCLGVVRQHQSCSWPGSSDDVAGDSSQPATGGGGRHDR